MTPEVMIGCISNIYTRMMHFKNAGDVEYGHTHNFDHMSLLATGKIKIEVEGKETIFTAPQMIFIHADKFHKVEALEDNTIVYCIHVVRDEEGNIIDPSMLPDGVTPRDVMATITK